MVSGGLGLLTSALLVLGVFTGATRILVNTQPDLGHGSRMNEEIISKR